MKLNVGCGRDIREGYINADIINKKEITYLDLDIFPYPFENNSIEEILAYSVLEHLENPRKSIQELKRILKDGGVLKFKLPHHASGNAYADVTHKHFFNTETLKIIGKELGFSSYKVKLGFTNSIYSFPVLKWFFNLNNTTQKLFDYYLCYIFRPIEIYGEFVK